MSFLNNSTNFSEISSGDPSINCVSFVLSGTYSFLIVIYIKDNHFNQKGNDTVKILVIFPLRMFLIVEHKI